MAKLRIRNNYGVAPNELLNSAELSLKAKGLFTYIQSKPDGWDFSAERMMLQNLDGRDAIRSALKELEKAGYLTRTQRRKEKGYWETEYTLCSHGDGLSVTVTGTDYPTSASATSDNTSCKKERVSKKDNSKKERESVSPEKGERKGRGNLEKKKTLEYLEAIPSKDVRELEKKYFVSERQIQEKGESLADYCRAHGKRYKDYSAMLRNAIKSDFGIRNKTQSLNEISRQAKTT